MEPIMVLRRIDFEELVTEFITAGAIPAGTILTAWQAMDCMKARAWTLPPYESGSDPKVGHQLPLPEVGTTTTLNWTPSIKTAEGFRETFPSVDLSEYFGREVRLDLAQAELYANGARLDPDGVRTVSDLVQARILAADEVEKEDHARILYRLYQNFPFLPKDAKTSDADWRINVTLFAPEALGKQRWLTTTVGHRNACTQVETHQVVVGQGLFLQQLMDERKRPLRGFFTVAQPGDLVSIIPGAWHATINISSGPISNSEH